MAKPRASRPAGPPRIDYLQVENYRALRHMELADLTPLTVLLGPNGSGKSTIFDVFNFLSECFTLGVRKAWDRRGRFRELRTRGSDGHLVFEIRYRECRAASERSQLLVTTHSPFFLNGLRAEEVRALYRDDHGYTRTVRAADVVGVPEFLAEGAQLGHLWLEGHLGVGDPLVNAGAPMPVGRARPR